METLKSKTVDGETHSLVRVSDNPEGRDEYLVINDGGRVVDDKRFTDKAKAERFFDDHVSTVQRGAGAKRNDSRGTGSTGFLGTFKQGISNLSSDASRAADKASESSDGESSGGLFGGGMDNEGGPSLPGGMSGGMEGESDGGPTLPGFNMGNDDQDGGPQLPGMSGGMGGEGGPQFPGFGGMDGQDGGEGPMLPGFGMGMEQEDTDADDEDEPKPFGFKY